MSNEIALIPTKEELTQRLILIESTRDLGDEERRHILADEALLEYINDDKVTESFNKIKKWYA